LINQYHQVDLAILGVGNNGHIAFNEPGTPINTETHIVNLTLSSRQANARFFNDDIDSVPKAAITMGLKEILAAKKILLIASGSAKKIAINHLKRAKAFDSN
jgi:glucosamine-6-phosphate deaminase